MLLVMLIVLGLLLLCLFVEEFFHLLNSLASPSTFWRSVLKATEKELMVLGVVSFALFTFEQSAVDGSESMEHFAELVEYVHLLLFFGMVFYYTFIALVGALSVRHIRRLREFEALEAAPYSKERELQLLEESIDGSSWCAVLLGGVWHLGAGGLRHERYHFYRMKNLFLRSQQSRPLGGAEFLNLQFSQFDYADYVSSATTRLFVKMIHVGWRMWMTVIVRARSRAERARGRARAKRKMRKRRGAGFWACSRSSSLRSWARSRKRRRAGFWACSRSSSLRWARSRIEGVLFCFARGCRGETPRTPPVLPARWPIRTFARLPPLTPSPFRFPWACSACCSCSSCPSRT
jgi:hypothetical protein